MNFSIILFTFETFCVFNSHCWRNVFISNNSLKPFTELIDFVGSSSTRFFNNATAVHRIALGQSLPFLLQEFRISDVTCSLRKCLSD